MFAGDLAFVQTNRPKPRCKTVVIELQDLKRVQGRSEGLKRDVGRCVKRVVGRDDKKKTVTS